MVCRIRPVVLNLSVLDRDSFVISCPEAIHKVASSIEKRSTLNYPGTASQTSHFLNVVPLVGLSSSTPTVKPSLEAAQYGQAAIDDCT